MSENKTRPTGASVTDFLDGVPAPRRADAAAVSALMARITGCDPEMWGPNIVGFGRYHYRYASGREGEWFLTGFSPRRAELVLYLMAGLSRYGELLERLGRHREGKSCLYVRRLEDVDLEVLEEIVRSSVATVSDSNQDVDPA